MYFSTVLMVTSKHVEVPNISRIDFSTPAKKRSMIDDGSVEMCKSAAAPVSSSSIHTNLYRPWDRRSVLLPILPVTVTSLHQNVRLESSHLPYHLYLMKSFGIEKSVRKASFLQ